MRPIPVALLILLGSTFAAHATPQPWAIEGMDSTIERLTFLPVEAGTPPAGAEERRLPSWPQATEDIYATPILYDLDDDGTMDVIVADARWAYVFELDGLLRPGWPVDIGGSLQHAAVGDLDGDGEPEILLGSNFPYPRIWCLDADGVSQPGWPVWVPYQTGANLSCPVLVDIDNDGEPEVGVAGEVGVYFYESDGTEVAGWPYLWDVPVNNPQWSAPAVGDLDADGWPEVAVGNACYPNWGVHVIRHDGTGMPGWPKVIKPVFASPALADLDGDGTLEVIVQEGDTGSQGYRLWVWHYDGTVMTGWPQTLATEGWSSRSNPAVADIQHDDTLEIVTMTADGKLHLFLPNGSELPGFPFNTGATQPIASVSVLDVNDDESEEVFLTYFLGGNQYVSGWDLDTNLLPGFPKLLFSGTDLNSHCSTHVVDADGDGDFDLTTAGSDMNSGRIWVLEVDGSVATPTTRADWPKIRRDIDNTGCFCGLAPGAVAEFDPLFGHRLIAAPNPYDLRTALRLSTPYGLQGSVQMHDIVGRRMGAWNVGAEGRLTIGRETMVSLRMSSGIYYLSWVSATGPSVTTARLTVLAR